MNKIQVLDHETVGRIAAGEVVERPASVVKEFIENSLDAGATSISIEIADGGLALIRVSDNGSGIAGSDVITAFTRHATSKIRSGDDLSRLSTLGFRGEALPSVAAVSDVTLRTRTRGALEGIVLTVSAGRCGVPTACGCPEGTSIEIRDLFKPTPARLKFMRKPSAEAGIIADVVAKAILQRPNVAFRLVSGGKTVYKSPGNGDLITAAFCVWGREAAEKLIPVEGASGYVKLSGLIGVGDQGRPSRSRQWVFVCGRPVMCPVVSQGLERATREHVFTGQYPSAILKLEIPLDLVDVNVHPNKLEVRFSDDVYIRDAVSEIVTASLLRKNATEMDPALTSVTIAAPVSEAHAPLVTERNDAEGPLPVSKSIPIVIVPARPKIAVRESAIPNILPSAPMNPPPAPTFGEKTPLSAEPTLIQLSAPPRLLSQLFNTYILIEHADRMLILDQHAAHERILYERFKSYLSSGNAAQPLLTPLVVTLTSREKQAVLDAREVFESIGFTMEDFGPTDIKLTSLPHILGAPQLKPFFIECVDDPDGLRSRQTPESLRDRIVKHACRKAVKGGDGLETEAILALVQAAGSVVPTCPHGRPIYIVVNKRDLEKRFGRILP